MVINTKFEKGEKAVIISDSSIMALEISTVLSYNSTISYILMKRKAPTMMDKDITVTKDEDECFKSIHELCEYYSKKL